MIDLGHFCLAGAWLVAIYGIIGGSIGARRNNARLCRSAVNSVYCASGLTILAFVSLAALFLKHDYHYTYVWQHSNNAMHPLYLISAIWGGMDGSMLLWAMIMGIFSALVLFRSEGVSRSILNWVTPVLSLSNAFFLTVVVFLTNPFRLIPSATIPPDGKGLNPLLQNPSMLIHPPCLYSGFTGFVVPFSFCLAALLSGNLSDSWTRVTRRWTLVAWGFLTCGIILGGNWAYIELGWGGFWAWDPVENASFLPWLTGTAFLHSVMVQQRRGMLKVWNISLAVLTYLLAVFGTFLTRSGIVQSVHAFAETDVGWIFLLYMGVVLTLAVGLIIYRWRELRPESRLESYLSREAIFLFNNLVLLGICFATFWGVMFPVISEAITGKKSVVGPPFFNQVNVPLFLALLFLMGVGPLIAWRKTSKKTIARIFAKPLLSGFFVTLLCLWFDSERPGAALAFGLSVFVIATVMAEFHRAARIRREVSGETSGVIALVRRRPQRYGGLIVHIGVAVMAVAITASMVYKIERDFTLKQGEQLKIGRFNLTLDSLTEENLENYSVLRAVVRINGVKDGAPLGELRPERRYYYASEETTTEVDIRMSPRDDLYLALSGLDINSNEEPQAVDLKRTGAAFKVFVNPLQIWLWAGGGIVLLGTIVVIGPWMKREDSLYATEDENVTVKA